MCVCARARVRARANLCTLSPDVTVLTDLLALLATSGSLSLRPAILTRGPTPVVPGHRNYLPTDIFLLTRIWEFRAKGFGDREAVLAGLAKTGHVITAAGVIMAIAFAGLLFSAEPVLNQISFFMVAAVLLDTLIVRTILVPALMVVLGPANWWPRKVPDAHPPVDLSSSGIKHQASPVF